MSRQKIGKSLKVSAYPQKDKSVRNAQHSQKHVFLYEGQNLLCTNIDITKIGKTETVSQFKQGKPKPFVR
jgi:hypothetical protein